MSALSIGVPKTERYRWTFPGCPAAVGLGLRLVERLRAEMESSRGDCQGLLFGRTRAGICEIDDFLPLAGFAPDAVMEAAVAAGTISGFYRIREGDHLQLNAEEKAVGIAMRAVPGSLGLLVLRRRGVPAVATFFFCDAIGTDLDFSFLDFPFEAAELLELERSRSRRSADTNTPLAVAPTSRGVNPQPPGQRRRKLLLLIAGVVATAAIAVGVLQYWGRTNATGVVVTESRPAPALQPASGLLIRAERVGSDIRITWDGESPALGGADGAALEISDAGAFRRILLTPEQLRFGNVLFSPKTHQVEVKLIARTANGPGVRGQVLILLNEPGGAVAVRPTGQAAAPAPVPSPVPVPPPSRPFVDRPRIAAPSTSLQEAPPTLAPAPIPSVPLRLQLPAVSAPAPAAPASAASSTTPPSTTPPSTALPFVPPSPLENVAPVTPPEMRPFLIGREVVVKIRVSVDERGVVSRAEVVGTANTHRMLINAALVAARRCKFRPARQGDSVVPAEALLVYTFRDSARR